MHFGIFVEEMRYGRDQVSAFRDAFELADQAEAWGLDCVWLGEIHFTPTRSVISASLQVASSIASRTRRLHVGTAVTVLPLNHPLRIAEEVATPAGLAPRRAAGRSQRLSAHPGLRLTDGSGRDRGAAREPHALLRSSGRAGAGDRRPCRRWPGRPPSGVGRAHGESLVRRRP